MAYAGGRWGSHNSNYYLNSIQNIPEYSFYWTMSPIYWDSIGFVAVFLVYGSGRLYGAYVDNGDGVRAVLNLNSEVLTAGGNGTADQPYIIGN